MHDLTDTRIKKEKPQPKPFKLADGGGLYLLIQPNGSRLWRWKYRHQGKEKLMTFGAYPKITLAVARDRHLTARKQLAEGIDPMAERKAAKREQARAEARSFEAVALAFHDWWKADKNPDYAADVKLRLERDIFPAIGHRPIDEIEPHEVVDLVKRIEQRGAREIANRAMMNCNQVFRYAMANNLGTRNPVAGLKPTDILKPAPVAHMARVDAKELPGLLRKMENYEGTTVTRLAMKLMALTFVRTSEMIGARWSEIDFKEKLWTIPASRMKQVRGKVAMKDHMVPLAPQTIDALESLFEITGSNLPGEADGYLFPHQWSKTQTMSKNTILEALYRMNYRGLMTGHGYRGVAATIINNDWPTLHPQKEKIIDIQLAHMPRNQVRAAYDKAAYLKERIEMMTWWADYLDAARARATGLRLVASA